MAKKRKKNTPQKKQSDETLIKERARKLPISKCYINTNWKDLHIAHIVVSRRHVNNNLTYAVLLVDLALYGAKDAAYRFNTFSDDLDQIIDNGFMEFVEIPYELAHNIVFSAIEWAEDFGFLPVKEWRTAQYIFEEDTDDIPLIDIECGIDGKPAIFNNSAISFKSDVDKLKATAGESNFSVFYEDGEEDGLDLDYGMVEQIIEDDIEQYVPEFYDDDFDIISRIDEIVKERPEVQIPLINKMYYASINGEKLNSFDLIEYTVGDKDIDFDQIIPAEQEAIVNRINTNDELFTYDEVLKHVKMYPDSSIFYEYLANFLHNEDDIDETGQAQKKVEELLFLELEENLFVTAFYLYELILSNQFEKFKQELERSNFTQKVLNYPGDIPKIIYIYFCCIRSLQEIQNKNVEEADIYYFASRIFTDSYLEYPCLALLSAKLSVEKMQVLEKTNQDPDENRLKVVHSKL